MMEGMLSEILEIPEKAWFCYEKTRDTRLPAGIPYLGMGSSFFACLALKYSGQNLFPEIASEYFHHISPGKTAPLGVLISQSGRSSEVIRCAGLFEEFIAITNTPDSPLTQAPNLGKTVLLHAGDEEFSSTKTYINTLVTLYNGFGIDIKEALKELDKNIYEYRNRGEQFAKQIHAQLKRNPVNGIYFLGNGPNIATAHQAALTFGETTHLASTAMTVEQFDHGPKETSPGSIVFMIRTTGSPPDMFDKLAETIKKAGAYVIPIEEFSIPGLLTPFTTIVRINFLTCYLAEELGIDKVFILGGKVTEE